MTSNNKQNREKVQVYHIHRFRSWLHSSHRAIGISEPCQAEKFKDPNTSSADSAGLSQFTEKLWSECDCQQLSTGCCFCSCILIHTENQVNLFVKCTDWSSLDETATESRMSRCILISENFAPLLIRSYQALFVPFAVCNRDESDDTHAPFLLGCLHGFHYWVKREELIPFLRGV